MTCEAYRAGVVTLKAAALAIGIFRRQKGAILTPAEVMEWTGAKKSQAYDAAQAARLFLAAQPISDQSINDSGIPGIPESRNPGNSDASTIPGIPEGNSGNPGKNRPPLINPPSGEIKRVVVDGGESPADGDAIEPFECENTSPPIPLPSGRMSASGRELVERFGKFGSWDDGTPYSRIVADLCDCHRADWVRLYFECQLEVWGRRPGMVAAAKTLRGWATLGQPGYRYTEAVAQQARQQPARASPGGEPDPDAHLPPWVREKRRKLAENKAKFDAYLAQHPPEPKGEAS
jgi:hypothetical protein